MYSKTVMRSSVLLIYVLFFIAADLKRICETENGSLEIRDDRVRQMLKKNGLATQCIQAKNAKSCKDMTLAQLCLKINSKMGGANNAIANNSITRLVFLPLRIIHQQRKSLTVKKDIKFYFFIYWSMQLYSWVASYYGEISFLELPKYSWNLQTLSIIEKLKNPKFFWSSWKIGPPFGWWSWKIDIMGHYFGWVKYFLLEGAVGVGGWENILDSCW